MFNLQCSGSCRPDFNLPSLNTDAGFSVQVRVIVRERELWNVGDERHSQGEGVADAWPSALGNSI